MAVEDVQAILSCTFFLALENAVVIEWKYRKFKVHLAVILMLSSDWPDYISLENIRRFWDAVITMLLQLNSQLGLIWAVWYIKSELTGYILIKLSAYVVKFTNFFELPKNSAPRTVFNSTARPVLVWAQRSMVFSITLYAAKVEESLSIYVFKTFRSR